MPRDAPLWALGLGVSIIRAAKRKHGVFLEVKQVRAGGIRHQ